MSDFDWISREFRWQTERIDDHFRTLTAKIDSLHKELARNSHDVTTSVQTNADRIRSMTDEELAAFWVLPVCGLRTREECERNFRTNCEACFFDWLKQPYKEVT